MRGFKALALKEAASIPIRESFWMALSKINHAPKVENALSQAAAERILQLKTNSLKAQIRHSARVRSVLGKDFSKTHDFDNGSWNDIKERITFLALTSPRELIAYPKDYRSHLAQEAKLMDELGETYLSRADFFKPGGQTPNDDKYLFYTHLAATSFQKSGQLLENSHLYTDPTKSRDSYGKALSALDAIKELLALPAHEKKGDLFREITFTMEKLKKIREQLHNDAIAINGEMARRQRQQTEFHR